MYRLNESSAMLSWEADDENDFLLYTVTDEEVSESLLKSSAVKSGNATGYKLYRYVIPRENRLLAHWKLDGNANNSAQNHYHGTLKNGARYTAGMLNNGVYFDGANDYIDLGNPAGLQNLNKVSIAAWIYPTTTSSGRHIVGKERAYKVDFTSGKVRFLTGNNWANTILTSAATLSPNRWYHITATYDGSFKRIYRNGTADRNTVSTSGSVNSSSRPLTMGAAYWGVYTNHFNGIIDDVRIYSTALSVAQAARLYSM